MNNSEKKILLIDAMNLLFRAYYAFIRNPLINSKGENTSAIYGFTNMILKLMDEEKTDYIGVVFESKTETFRDKLYDEYKANREKPPEDLINSIPEVKRLCKILSLKQIEKDGLEADDCIAIITKQAKSSDYGVRIASSDKDLYELVDDDVYLITTKKGISDMVVIDEKYITEKMDITPSQIWDYLSLTGDPSDNIPGVRGIGDKTATKLLSEYGSLNNILENLDDVKPKRVSNMIKEQMEQLELSRKLVQLKTDEDIGIDLGELKQGDINTEELQEFFKELEFYSLLDRFLDTEQPDLEEKELTYLDNEKDVNAFIKDAEKLYIFYEEDLLLIYRDDEIAKVDKSLFNPFIKAINKNDIEICGYNFKVLYKEMLKWKTIPQTFDFDIKIADYLLKPEDAGYSFEEIVFRDLGINLKKGDNRSTLFEDIRDYTTKLSLFPRLETKLRELLKVKELEDVFYEIELPLTPVLAEIENNGIAVNEEKLKDLSEITASLIAEIEEKIYDEVEQEFNVNSPKQLSHILFDVLKLPPQRKTKTGYSTDEEVLVALAEYHPLPSMIIEHRHLSKLKSTYIDPLPTYINPETGRIHTSFIQTGTSTGRLSSRNPNLQNIPIRTELGREVREAFIAGDGKILASFDYSQIELRIFAHLSGDENLKSAFINGKDIHTATATELFPDTPINPDLRRRAKAINFGLIYGKTPYGLSQELKIPVEEAEQYIKTYFEKYPEVKEFMDELIEKAHKLGYAETMFGRKRYLPELNSDNANIRRSAERASINMPIQGTSADIIKIAMININELIQKKYNQLKMVLTIHDELLFEVKEELYEETSEKIRQIMETTVELDVPIVVDYGYGNNWLEAH